MSQPTTPGEAVRVAAQRHAASLEASRTLARQIEEQRQKASEGTAETAPPESS